MLKRVAIVLLTGGFILSFYQNCSENMSFNSDSVNSPSQTDHDGDNSNSTIDHSDNSNTQDNGTTVCNPLDGAGDCSNEGQGLIGKLYYMTPEKHAHLFRNNNLNFAILKDYRDHGIQVPVNILMSKIDVSERSWRSGFTSDNGNVFKKEDGEKLFEYFHIDLNGFISLPQGDYQFKTISDDGIRITMNGVVVLEEDSVHAPEETCSGLVQFSANETKSIRIEYFQGPRDKIAIQFFYRPASEMSESCGSDSSWSIVPESAFTNINNY